MRELTSTEKTQLWDLENKFKTALIHHESGRLAAARVFYEKILDILPNDAETLDLFGRLLFEQGDLERAVSTLNQAVDVNPNSSSAWNHLGVALLAIGNSDGALVAFNKTTELREDHVEGHLNAAAVLVGLGQLEKSLPRARRAADLAPDQFATRLRFGVVLRALERFEEAVVELVAAVRLDPLAPETYLHLSICHGALDNPVARCRSIRQGIVVAPASHEIHTHLPKVRGLGFSRINPVGWARRATRLRPGEARMWDHLSAACYGENRFVETVRNARRSSILAPGSAASHNNLATGLYYIGDYLGSVWAARTGLIVSPDIAEIEFTLSQSAFCGGQTDLAWRHWPARLHLDESPGRSGLPPTIWKRGEHLEGRLLVCSEQGVGDDILYLSCLPDLMSEVADVIVECDPRWQAILERSLPGIVTVQKQLRDDPVLGLIHDYAGLVRDQGIAAHIPSGTLPEIYRRDVALDPPRGGYLRADVDEVEVWRRRLEALGPGPYIGVNWRSGLTLTPQRSLYYPDAVELISQLPQSNVNLISLQYGSLGDDLRRIQDQLGVRVHQFEGLDQTVELDRVAALMSCLDLVIAPSTTVCHLACSMGVPTIGMDKSNFDCVNERDPLFLNLYPVMRRDEALNPSLAASRAAMALKFFLVHGRLPRLEPGNS
ncbi:tetratricopeptide repeat protein [Alphaproteobacteria bacterium]|nr:tetratricopeptide repeat protein [Alphaproteobacteria bacterium]